MSQDLFGEARAEGSDMDNVDPRDHIDRSVAELNALIAEIKNNSESHIDGRVLSRAVESIFRIGLKKNEISSLTLSQVSLDDECITPLRSGGKNPKPPIRLTYIKDKEFIQGYLDSLNSNPQYSTSPKDPLFPGYQGKNGQKKFDRHLENFSPQLTYNGIHKLGIKAAFKKFLEKGQSRLEAKRVTAKKFRLSDREISAVITDTIQPAGKSKQLTRNTEVETLLEILDTVPILSASSPEVIKKVEDLRSRFKELAENSKFFSREEMQNYENIFIASLAQQDVCVNSRSGAIYVSVPPKPVLNGPKSLIEAIKLSDSKRRPVGNDAAAKIRQYYFDKDD